MDETVNPSGTEAPSSEDSLMSAFAAVVDKKDPIEATPEPEPEAVEPDQAESPEEEAEPEPEKHTVKVNGQEIEVSLDELKAGYQKDADYRQKTAELAERLRAHEAEKANQAAERAKAVSALNEADAVLRNELSQFEQVNWQQLAAEDPAQYVQLKAQYDAKVSHFQAVQYQQKELAYIEQQHQLRTKQERLQHEQQALLAKLPDWSDPKKAETEQKAIGEFLKNAGYLQEEIAGLDDHRAVILARKAMLFDALMAKKPDVQAKVEKAPQRVERTGSGVRPGDGRTAAMQKLTKTGKAEDAAALFKAFL